MLQRAMKCPICKADVDETAPPGIRTCWPFCSERCKLIDLGRWLGGRYQIPVPPDERDDLPPGPRLREGPQEDDLEGDGGAVR